MEEDKMKTIDFESKEFKNSWKILEACTKIALAAIAFVTIFYVIFTTIKVI